MIRYYIDGKDYADYGIIVKAQTGMLTPLNVKNIQGIDLPNRHGKIYDLSGDFYDERVITQEIFLSDKYVHSADLLCSFRNLFSGKKRLIRHDESTLDVRAYDVIWDAYENADFTNWRAGLTTITLKEPDPVKRVYLVGSTFSFTTTPKVSGETQDLLLISRGDGTFVEVRAGTHTHTYTDGYDTHIVIISGSIENVTITTTHQLLYSVPKDV